MIYVGKQIEKKNKIKIQKKKKQITSGLRCVDNFVSSTASVEHCFDSLTCMQTL